MKPNLVSMREHHRVPVGFTMLALTVLLSLPVLGADNPPDLTKGETNGVDRTRTYNLGATGLRGWIYTKPANFFESCQGRTTTASRQILVTHVGAKSPADGVMQVDDVILGAGGKLVHRRRPQEHRRGDSGGREGSQRRHPEADPLAGGQDRGGAAQAAGHGDLQRHRALRLPQVEADLRRGLQGAGEGAAEREPVGSGERPGAAGDRQSRVPAPSAGVRPQDGPARR